MAVYNGQKATWESIESLYTKLNTERTRLNIQPVTVTIPQEEGTPALAEDLNNLKELIVALRTNSYVNASLGATPFNNLSTANRGSLLKIDVFNDKEELLSRISSVCPHDGSFSSNSGYYASNNGYRASWSSPDFSYRDSCVSYDAGYRSSFYLTDNSYRVHNHSFGRNGCEGDKSYNGRGGG